MRRMWQKLLLITIILSCGIIFSLGSSARDSAPAKPPATRAAVENDTTAPPAKVVVYAQDRHGPW